MTTFEAGPSARVPNVPSAPGSPRESLGLRSFHPDEAGSLRIGVAGMGHRARLGWLPVLDLLPPARVVAVADPIEPLRLDGAARAGIDPESAYSDTDEMLARPDIDAVAVVVDPRYSASVAVKALEAGKHVICEVPLALTLDDCWRVVLAAERSGGAFALAEQLSFAPFVLAWRRMIEDGSMGAVSYGEAQYINGKGLDRYWLDQQTGRRLTWEQARDNPDAIKTYFGELYHSILYNPHSLAPLLRIVDDRIVRVTGMATPRPSRYLKEVLGEDVAVPDLEVALMQTASGAILRVAVSFAAPLPGPEPHHWFHLLGTRAEVETTRRYTRGKVPLGTSGLMWMSDRYLPGRVEVDWGFGHMDQVAARAFASGHSGLDYFPVHDFLEAILDGRAPVWDHYRAAEIAAAGILAGLSEERGSIPLDLPDFRPGPARRAGEPPAGGAPP